MKDTSDLGREEADTSAAYVWLGIRHRGQGGSPPRSLLQGGHFYSAPNTFFARLVAAAAGLARMLCSCLAIISNRPLSACSVT